MTKVAVFCEQASRLAQLKGALKAGGFEAVALGSGAPVSERIADGLVVDAVGDGAWAIDAVRAGKSAGLPVVAVAVAGPGPVSAILAEVDDFVIEPYQATELCLRLKRLVTARSKGRPIKAGCLVIYPDTYEALVDDRPLQLTYKEYELLRFLAAHPDRVWDRQTLLNKIWEYDYYGGARTVDVHIRRLRAKLGPRCADLIQTIRQVGYRFSKFD